MIVRFSNFFRSADLHISDQVAETLSNHNDLEKVLPTETITALRKTFPREPVNNLIVWTLKNGVKDSILWCWRNPRPPRPAAPFSTTWR